ncbi:hypothetical protein BC829DRAFT_406257, partial [Chytridium lagenaria]
GIHHFLFFAAARDAAGGSTQTLDLPETMMDENRRVTLKNVVEVMKGRFPELVGILGTAMIAVNQEYVEREVWMGGGGNLFVKETDEIAVIPPVSGG